MHMKLVSFLRLIVNSCIAELDLFRLTCRTLIFLLCSRDSGRGRIQQGSDAMVDLHKVLDLGNVKASGPLRL